MLFNIFVVGYKLVIVCDKLNKRYYLLLVEKLVFLFRLIFKIIVWFEKLNIIVRLEKCIIWGLVNKEGGN